MSGDPARRIAVAFARETARSPSARLCAACVEVLEVTSAGITVLSGAAPGPICVSDGNAAELENVQFATRQGPCQDAYRSERPVHAPNLDGPVATRWPPFVELARARGIRAVSAYPVMNETAKVGVLTLYRAEQGDLSGAQNDDSVAVARVLADTLANAGTGDLLALNVDDPVPYRAEIYQASGMTAVHLGVSPDVALRRIHAYSDSHEVPVVDVAAAIVSHRFRLPADGPDLHPRRRR